MILKNKNYSPLFFNPFELKKKTGILKLLSKKTEIFQFFPKKKLILPDAHEPCIILLDLGNLVIIF